MSQPIGWARTKASRETKAVRLSAFFPRAIKWTFLLGPLSSTTLSTILVYNGHSDLRKYEKIIFFAAYPARFRCWFLWFVIPRHAIRLGWKCCIVERKLNFWKAWVFFGELFFLRAKNWQSLGILFNQTFCWVKSCYIKVSKGLFVHCGSRFYFDSSTNMGFTCKY